MTHPGPRARISVRATEPSSQTPGFAAVTQAGLDTTVLSVNAGRRGTWHGWREEVSAVTCSAFSPDQCPDPVLSQSCISGLPMSLSAFLLFLNASLQYFCS